MGLLFFDSIYKEKIWGSEIWLVSAHHSGDTVIKCGEHQGKRLSEVYEDFPLLVKIVKADEDLSIQVHPDDAYAQKHESSNGKTECWYVMDAKEGASLIVGHNAKSKAELVKMIEKGEWDSLLKEVKVKKGDFFQIEAGTVHAIKGGVKLLEIQQSSDVTYRLYDYDRLENEKKRELHIQKCIDVIVCPYEEKSCGKSEDTMVECDCYNVERLSVHGRVDFRAKGKPVIASCIEGSGFAGDKAVSEGDSFVIPPLSSAELKGDMAFLISY